MTKTEFASKGEIRTRQSRGDVYGVITDRVISLLEAGTVPWRVPWKSSSNAPQNFISRKPYRGINAFLLNAIGYGSRFWLTFRQTQSLGGSVRPGEKASPVVFWKWIEIEEDGERKEVPILRYYHVFNLGQVTLPESKVPTVPQPGPTFSPIEEAERVVAAMPNRPEIRHGTNQPSYSPAQDTVLMPAPDSFDRASEYYSTLFHELTHSTGHAGRLSRPEVTERSEFGSDPYSREELVAEMGSAFLCGHCGLDRGTLDNSAAYIKNWIARLKGDHRLVISAAGKAQKSCDFILGSSPIGLEVPKEPTGTSCRRSGNPA